MEILNGVNPLIENPNEVYHDNTLYGKGTKEVPLKVRSSALSITLPATIPSGAAPTTDLSVTGITTTFTANENQGFGDVVFINASGKAQLGDATVIATASCIALCTGTVLANATGTYLLQGFARKDAWTWTVGDPVYLSLTGTTTNTVTQTAPSATDEVIQILGIATHADRIYFNPSLSQVEHI